MMGQLPRRSKRSRFLPRQNNSNIEKQPSDLDFPTFLHRKRLKQSGMGGVQGAWEQHTAAQSQNRTQAPDWRLKTHNLKSLLQNLFGRED